ncbi:hypothetical protein [Streptomyces sp. NPDC002057]|uniref:hypothetical protein n=1 Tax=Streptomyces sp. NPDC002057 TaxID=3154664 RepID=UPI003324B73D
MSSVTDRRDLSPRTVYDLTVGELHTFYVGTVGDYSRNIVVHNCLNIVGDEGIGGAHTLGDGECRGDVAQVCRQGALEKVCRLHLLPRIELMMMSRHEFDEDFGLSGIAGKFQYPHVPLDDAAAAAALVTAMAEERDGTYGIWLLKDVRRLLASPLPDDVIVRLWLAVTATHFDPTRHGMSGRDWMERIAELCADRVPQGDHAAVPDLPEPVIDEGLTKSVLEQVRGVGPMLAEAAVTTSHAVPLADIVAPLEKVIAEVDADLGFRLFLRALKAYFVRISAVRQESLLALGERFGYNRDVVDEGCLNVWPELD